MTPSTRKAAYNDGSYLKKDNKYRPRNNRGRDEEMQPIEDDYVQQMQEEKDRTPLNSAYPENDDTKRGRDPDVTRDNINKDDD